MMRSDMFALRISSDERRMIEALAGRLQRTQSDAVRLVIREAVGALLLTDGADVSGAAGWAPKRELVVGREGLGHDDAK